MIFKSRSLDLLMFSKGWHLVLVLGAGVMLLVAAVFLQRAKAHGTTHTVSHLDIYNILLEQEHCTSCHSQTDAGLLQPIYRSVHSAKATRIAEIPPQSSSVSTPNTTKQQVQGDIQSLGYRLLHLPTTSSYLYTTAAQKFRDIYVGTQQNNGASSLEIFQQLYRLELLIVMLEHQAQPQQIGRVKAIVFNHIQESVFQTLTSEPRRSSLEKQEIELVPEPKISFCHSIDNLPSSHFAWVVFALHHRGPPAREQDQRLGSMRDCQLLRAVQSLLFRSVC